MILRLPRTVVVLGLVSFLNDAASEMITPLPPGFLVTTLGAGPAIVGLIEGTAESLSCILKLVSGWLVDRGLNQIEIFFLILQRKALTPNDFPSLEPSPSASPGLSATMNRSPNPSSGNSHVATSQRCPPRSSPPTSIRRQLEFMDT